MSTVFERNFCPCGQPVENCYNIGMDISRILTDLGKVIGAVVSTVFLTVLVVACATIIAVAGGYVEIVLAWLFAQ